MRSPLALGRAVYRRLPVPLLARVQAGRSPIDRLPGRRVPADGFGALLVVAPHPDDESLACGGVIAAAAAARLPVRVVFVTDGEASHLRSPTWPAERLGAERRREAMGALAALGARPDAARFLHLPDRSVPHPGREGFAAAVEAFRAAVSDFAFDTVCLPWRREPSGDHQGSWHIATAARGGRPGARLEYPVWLFDRPDALPAPHEAEVLRVDVARFRRAKRRAVAAHRTQTTDLIDDDPTGFRLSGPMLAWFDRDEEVHFLPHG
jgi:LmbE family N-acetylglucosaminyl deacetylase